MANDETMMMMQFTLRYKGGFGRGNPKWYFPKFCACCGTPSDGVHKVGLVHTRWRTDYSMNINVPYCMTCMGHVKARDREDTIALVIGIVIGVVVSLLVAYIIRPMHSLTDMFDYTKGEMIVIGLAGIGTLFLARFALIRLLFRRAGSALPRNSNCTMPLAAKLKGGPKRPDLDVILTCANPTFADRFREMNRAVIADEAPVIGNVIRTPRGDVRFVRARRAAG